MRYVLTIGLLILSTGCGSGGAASVDPEDPAPAATNADPGGDAPDAGGATTANAQRDQGSVYAELYPGVDLDNIRFLDEPVPQAAPEVGLRDLEFVDRAGRRRRVAEFAPEKTIVLVVTRGNTEPICPYCSTQTADYVRRHDEIVERGAEVVLAYPVKLESQRGNLELFLADARGRLDDPGKTIPFPVVFDVELKAVDALGIRKDLSKPATYIVDPQGRVRFSYVGKKWPDRPSVQAVLDQLDRFAAAEADDVPSPGEPSGVLPP